MDQPIQMALVISIVGMLTVFLILSLIVVSGYLLMRALEKTNFVLNQLDEDVDQDRIHKSVIEKAIAQWSSGKASVSSIKKLD